MVVVVLIVVVVVCVVVVVHVVAIVCVVVVVIADSGCVSSKNILVGSLCSTWILSPSCLAFAELLDIGFNSSNSDLPQPATQAYLAVWISTFLGESSSVLLAE